jgi:hypothetical protein
MGSELMLRRKWTLRARGDQVVFVKRRNERAEHVVMKALLWALYLPVYPGLKVEIPVGDRYKPDVVAVDPQAGHPRFWAEAGRVSPQKIEALAKRYRRTHFAIGKWDSALEPLAGTVRRAMEGFERSAPFDLIRFPWDSHLRFIDADGVIDIDFDDLEWQRYPEDWSRES